MTKTSLPVRDAERNKPRAFRFTDDFLKRAMSPGKLKGRREVVQFEDGTGLGVRVSASNVSFLVQLPRKGRPPYRATVGRWGVLTVEQARNAVKALAGKIALGIDLDDERREIEAKAKAEAEAEEAKRFTVRVLVDRWNRDHLSGRRPNYAKGAYKRVIHHFKHLLDVPAHLIDRKEVKRAAEKTRDEAGPAAARNALLSLKSAYRWALGEDLIDADPLNGIKLPPKTGDRERVLSLDEARRIWAATSRLDYPGGLVVQLLWLTGCRRGEIAGLRWDEVVDEVDDKENVVGKVVEIPPARTKTGAGHRVPLSKAALQVIDEAKRDRIVGSPYVFSSDGAVAFRNYARVKIALDAALDVEIKDWRWHDTRRSIVTYLAGPPRSYDPVVIDLLLGHAPSKLSPTARIYQRFEHADTRREMLETWAAALTQPSAEVVGIKTKVRKRG
jgi:integrase